MENLKLNETPIRTARNFNINNIKLENIELPEVIQDFKNLKITGNDLKIDINSRKSNCNLSYGLGDILTNQINEKSNCNLKIMVDKKENKETLIEFNFDEKNEGLIDNVEITANEESSATIIIKYNSKSIQKCYHNGIIKTIAHKNSNIKIILVNLLSTISNNFISIENQLEESSKVNYTIVDFGGKNSITNYYSNLVGDYSENIVDTVYLGKENQLFDLNYITELKGKNANVNMEIQGALKDNAIKHFKGTIDFKKGSKKSKGNENEFCFLLSDKAKSLGLPMLLCSEEDVEGNHASSARKNWRKRIILYYE